MTIATVARLIETVRDCHVLNPAQIEELTTSLQTTVTDPGQLCDELIRRGWLTSYQMEQVLQDQGKDLVLGKYVLLEPVGEGGMGQVFKARDSEGQVVALKVIRKEQRTDARALRRFRREIKAVMRLSHPNIIRGFDAAEEANAHYFAMEFVKGINLDRIIDKGGPLPFAPALDYARQTTLGLHHANECGLIHRDIKPSNLFITPPAPAENGAQAHPRFGRWGIVKIFDLGLVLLNQHEPSVDSKSNLTKKGYSLGSVDYVAPEQVMNPHGVDIRADLYSLGCTLYEMLTGSLPFPEGSPVKKLYYHQSRMPVPVEKLRPDTPAEVVAIVQKLMAKKPEDRYQTPAELAQHLGKYMDDMDPAAVDWGWMPPIIPVGTPQQNPSSRATPEHGAKPTVNRIISKFWPWRSS